MHPTEYLHMAIPAIVRTVSGKGVVKIPESYLQAKQILLYVDLLRPSSNEYANVLWSPSRHFYGHVTFCIDTHVLYSYDVNFARQVFEIYDGQPSQNLLALICSHENVLDSFVQYALASGFPYVKNNSIINFQHSTFLPDTIRFYCYSDCALQLGLIGFEYNKCADNQGEASPPPTPPPPVTLVPPGTPVEVSPAYDGESDEGDTVPAPIDEDFVPPPFGDACVRYRVTISASFRQSGAADQPITQDFLLWGEIGEAIIETNLSGFKTAVVVQCRGPASSPCAQYRGYDTLVVQGTPNSDPNRGYVDATIDDIVIEP